MLTHPSTGAAPRLQPGTQLLSGNFTTFICGACALSRKYLPPLPQTVSGRGQQKIEDVPPLLHTDPMYRPARLRPAGHLARSRIPVQRQAGRLGGITRERGPLGGHSGPGYWSWRFLVLGSFMVPPPALVSPWQHPPTWLSLPPPSRPQAAPLGSWGLCLPLPVWSSRGEVMASQRLPQEPCHSCSRRGRGACGRSSCINAGAGASPPESLGEFADDADQGCVLILEPLVVSPEVGQGLWDGTGSAGGPGQAKPTAHSARDHSPSAPPPAQRPFSPGPCAPAINGGG